MSTPWQQSRYVERLRDTTTRNHFAVRALYPPNPTLTLTFEVVPFEFRHQLMRLKIEIFG